MSLFFKNHINVKGRIKGYNTVDYGLVFQDGFKNVSGHVDVVYNKIAAGTYYDSHLRGSLHDVSITKVWWK